MTRSVPEPGQLEGDVAAILGFDARDAMTGTRRSAKPSRLQLAALVAVLAGAVAIALPWGRSLYDPPVDTAFLTRMVPIAPAGAERSPSGSDAPAPERRPAPVDTATPVSAEPVRERPRADRIVARAMPLSPKDAPLRRVAERSIAAGRSADAGKSVPLRAPNAAAAIAAAQPGRSSEGAAGERVVATALAAGDPAPALPPAGAEQASVSAIGAPQDFSAPADANPDRTVIARSRARTRTQQSLDAIRLLRRQ